MARHVRAFTHVRTCLNGMVGKWGKAVVVSRMVEDAKIVVATTAVAMAAKGKAGNFMEGVQYQEKMDKHK